MTAVPVAAVRLELLNHPQIALRLVLAHMIVGSNLWMVKPEPLKAAKPEISASVAANPATVAFEERRKELLALCGLEEDRSELVRPNGDDYSLVSLFVRLLKLPEDDVLRLMALAMAETLASGTATAEATAMKPALMAGQHCWCWTRLGCFWMSPCLPRAFAIGSRPCARRMSLWCLPRSHLPILRPVP